MMFVLITWILWTKTLNKIKPGCVTLMLLPDSLNFFCFSSICDKFQFDLSKPNPFRKRHILHLLCLPLEDGQQSERRGWTASFDGCSPRRVWAVGSEQSCRPLAAPVIAFSYIQILLVWNSLKLSSLFRPTDLIDWALKASSSQSDLTFLSVFSLQFIVNSMHIHTYTVSYC